MVKTHKFNNVLYHIVVDEPYVGWCDRPRKPDAKEYPSIRIPNGLSYGNRKKAKDDLITLLHECNHAENWDLSEKRVDQIAIDIGTLLWRLGYRRVKRKVK